MASPVFSVIVTTRNRPHLLSRAVRSVLCQTFREFELIIVDDGGGPETGRPSARFSDPRIVLVRHDRTRGAAAACNTGIRASRGSLISILGDDDEYFPTFLEKVRLFFRSAPESVGFVWTGIRGVTDTPEGEVVRYERAYTSPLPPGEGGYIEATTIGNGFGFTMRRACIDVVGLYNEDFPVCADTEHLFRLARRFDFAAVPEILVKIHHHGDGQLTHEDRDALRLDFHQRILDENADFTDRYPGLYRVHARRLAGLCYRLNRKEKGRRLLLRIWRKTGRPVSTLLDAASLELFGVDSSEWLNASGTRKRLSRMKTRLLGILDFALPGRRKGGRGA